MEDIRRTIKMTIQNILDELNNIKEQAVNSEDIGKESILEAVTDLIHDIGGNDGFDFEGEETYDAFDTTDFTQLEVM
jgi:hypothetical protein